MGCRSVLPWPPVGMRGISSHFRTQSISCFTGSALQLLAVEPRWAVPEFLPVAASSVEINRVSASKGQVPPLPPLVQQLVQHLLRA